MPEADLFLLFVRPLNRAGIPYMIGGSVASIFYGEPRLTHDVDFIITLAGADIRRLIAAFPESDFYVPPAEFIAEEARRERGHFNLIHEATGFKADFYPAGHDELNAWGLQWSRRIEFDGETVILAPPEYVIARKLEYFREGGSEKHLRDFRSLLAVSGEQIDSAKLGNWVRRLNLEAQWGKLEPGP
jgi:hypothetical protein